MSDSFAPVFKSAAGRFQQFGGEQTLTWDFTSAAGNPLELVVGGSTYFTFGRTGELTLESNILWNLDAGGNVGAQYDTRPNEVHVVSSVAVGAVSGVGDGAQLLLDRLVLGHADVDKYIDAEQGLASTPFMRYNATHHRWEYSNDGINVFTFGSSIGVTTWDDLYAADKLLLINATTLQWVQASTSDVAFAVSRNLGPGDTTAPIMTVSQEHATDDQPPFALAQSNNAASILDLYDGLVGAGTVRYGFGGRGRLNIVGSVALATEMVRLEQNAATMPFLEFRGTAGAGVDNSISTDAAPIADMLQVEVDIVGVGLAKRWIPAYVSAVPASVPTWDSIYAIDKDLNISVSPLLFEQTSTSDYAFIVSRNLTAANTDASIFCVENQNAADDQGAVYFEGSAGPGITKVHGVAHVLAISTGLTGGGEVLTGVKSEITENVADAAGTELRAFYADVSGAAGSGTKIGYRVTDAFTWGIYANSPALFEIDTTGTPLNLGVVICDTAGVGVSYPFAVFEGSFAAPTPRFVVHRDGQTNVNADNTAVAFLVTQNDATTGNELLIQYNDGNAAATRFDFTQLGAALHTPASPVASFDTYKILATSGGLTAPDVLRGLFVDFTGAVGDVGGSLYGVDLLYTDGGGATDARGVNITGDWNYGLYSTRAIAIDMNLADTSFVVAQAGAGDFINLITGTLSAGDRIWTIDNIGQIAHGTSPNPTTAFTAYSIDLISAGMNASLLAGLAIALSGNVADLNFSPQYGIDLQHLGGAGGSSFKFGINITGAWDRGIYSTSGFVIDTTPTNQTCLTLGGPFDIIQATAPLGQTWTLGYGHVAHVDNTLANASAHSITATSDLGDGQWANSLYIASIGGVPGHVNSLHYSIYVEDYSDGTGATLGVGIFVGEDFVRGLECQSPAVIEVATATTAATVAQNGAGAILTLIDGTVAGGTPRVNVNKDGGTVIDASSGSYALEVIQNNAASNIFVARNDPAWMGFTVGIDGYTHTEAAEASGVIAMAAMQLTDIAGDILGYHSQFMYLVDLTVDGRTLSNFQAQVHGRAGDTVATESLHIGYHAKLTATGVLPADTKVKLIGFYAEDSFSYGLYSKSVSVIEVNNATAPALALAQAGAGSILELKEGTFAAGTTRYSFGLKGLLDIVSDAASTTELLRLEQNATTKPFVEFRGTAAAGAGSSISTDAGVVADMLQVEVDIVGGGGPAKRWIPAYASTALAAANTLQAAYDAGNTIVTAGGRAIDFTLTTGDFSVVTSVNGSIVFSEAGGSYLDIAGDTGEVTLAGIANHLMLKTRTSGNVVIAPASGGDLTLTTLGAGGEITLSSASIAGAGAIQLDASAGGISIDAAGASNFTVTGNTLLLQTTGANILTVNGGGGVAIAGNASEIDLTTSGALDLNSGVFTLDCSTATVTPTSTLTFNATGGNTIFTCTGRNFTVDAAVISLDGTAASNFTVTGNTLTLQTTGANALTVNGGGGVNIAGNAAEIDITTTNVLDVNSGAFTLDCSSATITPTSTLTFDATGGNTTFNCTGRSFLVDAADISLDGTAASNLTVTGNTLTLQTTGANILTVNGGGGVNIAGNASEIDLTTSGALDLNSGVFTLDCSTATVTPTSTLTFDVTGGDTIFTCTGRGFTVDALGISLDGTAASNFSTSAGNLTLSAGAALDLDAVAGNVTIDAAASYDIVLTAASHVNSDIIFQAHGGTAVNFNDATYDDLDVFPVGRRSICGALDYLLNSPADNSISDIMAGEVLAEGLVVGMEDVGGVPKLYKAEADHANNRKYPIGVVKTGSGAGAYPEVYVGGRVPVYVEAGSGLADVANVGAPVFVTTDNDGYLSTTRPTSGVVTRVGWLAQAGTNGNVDGYIILSIGEHIQL